MKMQKIFNTSGSTVGKKRTNVDLYSEVPEHIFEHFLFLNFK